MSKMVVGMKIRPAIKPHKIDCGFLKTHRKASRLSFQLPDFFSVDSSFGSRRKRIAPMANPATPIPIQKLFHEIPLATSGPTPNCPTAPPAIPNICVAPINVAACEGEQYFDAREIAPTSANTPQA